jgi:hypothetical protein
METAEYDDQGGYEGDGQEEQYSQASERSRSESLLPVPYQSNRRSWGQASMGADYEEKDEAEGSSPNLPMPFGMGQGSAFGALTEEELASRLPPGRKPPAFIPATRPRRPYRLSRYRILSGTISLALVGLLVAGALGFLAVHTGFVAGIFGNTPLSSYKYPFAQPTLPVLSGTPQATPSDNQASKSIVKVTTALHYSSAYEPIGPTTNFQTGQNVNVLWQAKQAKVGDVISVIWYQDGNPITDSHTPKTTETFPKAGTWNGIFALCYPTSGLGKAELYWDGQLAQSIEFVVKGNPTNCPAN